MSWAQDIRDGAAEIISGLAKEPEDVRAAVALNTVLFQIRVAQFVLKSIQLPNPAANPLCIQASFRLHEAAAWLETAIDATPIPRESDSGDAEVASTDDLSDNS